MEIAPIIEKIADLKPMAAMNERLMQIACNPDSSVADMVAIIQYDPGITANLLRICNSSYFALQRRISSVKQAVAYLGMEKVACLVMLGSSANNFNRPQPGYDLDNGELWRYSVGSALMAQQMAEHQKLTGVSTIFTAALLKDIGKTILHHYVAGALQQILEAVADQGMTFVEAERSIIGIDHAELGARVAQHWNLGADLVHLIRHHHLSDPAQIADPAVGVVYLADCVCMMIGIGVGADGLSYRFRQPVLDQLGFSEKDIQRVIVDFWEQMRGVEELVKLSKGEG